VFSADQRAAAAVSVSLRLLLDQNLSIRIASKRFVFLIQRLQYNDQIIPNDEGALPSNSMLSSHCNSRIASALVSRPDIPATYSSE
jgi:hypothetical protein